MSETNEVEATKAPDSGDNVCIDCSILGNPEDRKKCEELTTELAKETIDLETFSNAMIGMLTGDEEQKADKLLSVFCDPAKITPEIENGDKEGIVFGSVKEED